LPRLKHTLLRGKLNHCNDLTVLTLGTFRDIKNSSFVDPTHGQLSYPSRLSTPNNVPQSFATSFSAASRKRLIEFSGLSIFLRVGVHFALWTLVRRELFENGIYSCRLVTLWTYTLYDSAWTRLLSCPDLCTFPGHSQDLI